MIDIDRVVTLDWETYYDSDFSLRKMSTSEYIRHEDFLVHMVGLKIGNEPTKVLDAAAAQITLKAIDWTQHDLLCHHTAFDGFILSHHYGITPRRYLCTLSMARGAMPGLTSYALGAVAKLFGLDGKLAGRLEDAKGKRALTEHEFGRLAEYCARDLELTREIFDRLSPRYPSSELELIDLTIRMFTQPVLQVNTELAGQELSAEYGGKVAAVLLAEVSPEQLMSNDKFAKVLGAQGVTVPVKISKTTGHLTYALAKNDPEFRQLLHHPNQRVRDLVEARLKVKSTIGETRAKRLLEEGKDGPLPVFLNYYGAHTGRWSGGNKMNLQNLPRPEYDLTGKLIEESGRLRRALEAPPGCVLGVADSAQIEARMTAWLADQSDLLQAFREGRDVYCEFASKLFMREVTKRDRIPRFVGKTCILGLGFGMGAQRLHETLLNAKESLDIPVDQCQIWVDAYRVLMHRIPLLWKQMDYALLQMMTPGAVGGYKCLRWGPGRLKLPNDMFLLYMNLGRDENNDLMYGPTVPPKNKVYGGLLTENVVQALARIIVADQMRVIAKRYPIVTMTHDEVVALIPESEAEDGHAFMIEQMSIPPAWAPDLPLKAEGGFDVSYCK